MGEQSQAQPKPQPQAQSLPEKTDPQTSTTTPTAADQATSTTTTTTTATDQPNAPPQNPSPPSTKIPIRPRKIRKLSPDTAVVVKTSQPPSSAENDPKTAVTATTAKTPRSKIAVAPPPQQPKPISTFAPRSLSRDGEVEIAIRHLRNADPLLAPLIDLHQPPSFDSFQTPFLALTRSILYQQLAYKAGTSIYTRFVALCGGESAVLPDTVLALTSQQLRQIGVSGRKTSYLHDLSKKYQNGILSDTAIAQMDDKSLFTMLTMVNGIGSWSVHMFMIFSLHRPDVLPVNDLGVRKGVQLLYGLEELPRPSQMDQLCEKWRPYRSVASWYMWRFVEAKGPPASSTAMVVAGNGGGSLQQEQQKVQQQQQQQQQYLDPITGILNIRYCFFRFIPSYFKLMRYCFGN